MIDFRNCDCVELMAEYEDNHFDLAIVDPPYGIGESGSTNKTRSKLAVAKNYKSFAGDDLLPPSKQYFEQLCRVSKNQVIWGANHFIENVASKNSSCWLVWDKLNESSDFADCELAYTSFNTSVRKFTFQWAGMLQGDMKNKEIRIHPTQKPVRLYTWILSKYAKDGDKILDTHVGSASSLIACHQLGFDVVGCELDKHYYELAQKRIKEETSQLSLF